MRRRVNYDSVDIEAEPERSQLIPIAFSST